MTLVVDKRLSKFVKRHKETLFVIAIMGVFLLGIAILLTVYDRQGQTHDDFGKAFGGNTLSKHETLKKGSMLNRFFD